MWLITDMWLNGIVMPFSHLSRTSSSLVMSFILWWLLLSRVIGEVVPWKTITPENSNPCKRGFSKRTRTLQKTIFSCYTTHTYIQIQFNFLIVIFITYQCLFLLIELYWILICSKCLYCKTCPHLTFTIIFSMQT